LAVFESDSPEDLTKKLVNLQSLSVEELMKIGEAQMIESELEKQLEIKHQRELIEHFLRQREEMRELKKQLKTMSLKEDSGHSMASSADQPISLDSLVIPRVIEKDGKWQAVGSEEALDIPLSPELSPLEAEVSLGDSCGDVDGMFAPEDIVTTYLPFKFPNENSRDRELESMQCSKWKSKQVNPSNQVFGAGRLRIPNLMQPQYGLRNGNRHSFKEMPKISKFDTHLFKTEICCRWTQMGCCLYGESCQFAHGMKELRMRPIMHKKFKTVRCKKYLAGYCPYGTRCCFLHDISERRMTVPNISHYLPPGRHAAMWTDRDSYKHGSISPLSVWDMDMCRRRSRQVTTYHARK